MPAGVECISARVAPGAFAPHSHPYLTLALSDRGTGLLTLGENTYQLPPGAVVIIPPGTIHAHAAKGHDDWHVRSISIPAPVARMALGQNPGYSDHDLVYRGPWIAEKRLWQSLQTLMPAHSIGPVENERAIEVFKLLTRHSELVCQPSPLPQCKALSRVCLAARSVYDQPSLNWSPASLAASVSVSVSQLNRGFAEYLGISPMRFLRTARLHHVRAAIQRGRRLDYLADRYRFSDLPHLVRSFDAVFGITPGQYARTFARNTGTRAAK